MTRPMEYAYQFIKDRILDGTYRPSQKLNESDLSKLIGVSRNTVKKALLKLERENLVEIEENKGATVKSHTLDEILNYLEIREVLEGLLARRAAASITDGQLRELQEVYLQMEDHLKNNRLDEYSNLNRKFHQIIYDASENRQAVEMVNVIKTQLLRYHLRTVLVPGRNQESLEEHRQILEALQARDPALAEERIRRHVGNIRQTIQTHHQILV
ncbi:MAG TPA: GntR family transcriptional regulator [Paenibacillaceae bacterium]